MLQRKAGRFVLVTSLLVLIVRVATAAPVPAPPELAAEAYLLIDHHSGRVLVEKNADAAVEPASITKLMTAYVVERALESGDIQLDDEVEISVKAWRMKGSRMFVKEGTEVSVDDLLKGMIIQSGNDASVALAEHVAGTEDAFVGYMNHHAERLGMAQTHYDNVTGWPVPTHVMSARDIATLTRAMIDEFPERYRTYSVKEYSYNGIKQYNRNRLLWRDESVDGVKTGHTEAAGYCLVSSARRGDMRLIAVVLGAESEDARAEQSQALLNYGFRFFETHRLYAAEESLKEARIWKGDSETLPLGLSEDLFVTIPRGQYQNLEAEMMLPDRIVAPAAQGQSFGEVRVGLNGEPLATRSLVALVAVKDGGLLRRALDSARMLFD